MSMHTRRIVLRTGFGLAAAATVAATATTARAQDEKLEKPLVQYQDNPKDGQECDKCVNWVAPNACKIVAGSISPKGWCVAFAPQGG